MGRLRGVTDALGGTTRSEYNVLDQVVRLVDANDGLTRFEYDPVKGAPSAVIDALNHAVESYTTDPLHRLTERRDALGAAETFGYDAGGRLVRSVDRKGEATLLSHDALNRVVRIDRADGNQETRSYDLAGRLVHVQDAVGIIRLEYDPLDRLILETTDVDGVVNAVAYEYDALGRRTRRAVNGSDVARYTYDNASRIRTIEFAVAGAPPGAGRTASYDWDAASRLRVKTLLNGMKQVYEHDNANRLLAIRYLRGDGSELDTIRYDYDDNGRRVGKTMGFFASLMDTPMTGAYDDANRMVGMGLPVVGESCVNSFNANGSLVARECSGTGGGDDVLVECPGGVGGSRGAGGEGELSV
ncbi:MAG: RHS repeat protein [Rubrivivax sp.]|nr:RHS repeat protein [Rubrivivax sp.]